MTYTKKRKEETSRRFWAKVDKTSNPNGCWEWKGAENTSHYGVFWADGKLWIAHRYAWSVMVGVIPEGMYVCHRCNNRKCVNPAHLFIGTQKDNIMDMIRKKRHLTKHKPEAVLAHEVIQDIKYWLSMGGSVNKLAVTHNVKRNVIISIRDELLGESP